jgi:Leucine-rich repeat (LRR) protein
MHKSKTKQWCPANLNSGSYSKMLVCPLPSFSVAFLYLLVSCGALGIPRYEYDALHDLFVATNGSNWRWLGTGSQWNFSTNAEPCTWEGITCYSGRVVGLDVEAHRLDGTIPNSLGNLTALSTLDLSYNKLTGSIPAKLCNLHVLDTLYLEYNMHNGTIPSGIGNLQELTQLSLFFNQLSGSIPDSIITMTKLVGLGLNNNRLTGTIPPQLGQMTSMAGCRLHNNRLHGPIPNTLNSCPDMIGIVLFNNSLTGTIPSNIGELKKLSVIQLFDNKLTGTAPATISDLPVLTVLMLGTNHLTGSVDGVVNATVQRVLSTVQFDNNQFTGTLPRAMFSLPALVAFSAVGNCFQGSLPDNICQAAQLTTLALDGLSSATNCQDKLLPGLSTSYQPLHPVAGTVPSCLFALPKLQTLHLSGNGFTGSLPAELDVSVTLADLSLSHNKLRGPVPHSIQTKEWYNLDLSYNYLQGELSPDFAPQRERNISGHLIPGTSLSLENNRLSGRLPQAVTQAPTLSVLRGNLFSCAVTREDLPQNDDNVSNYQCGSRALDAVYYTWLACICVALGSVAVVMCGLRHGAALPKWSSTKWETLSTWYFATSGTEGKDPTMPHLCHLYLLAGGIVKGCAYSAVILLMCFLPLYGLEKVRYSTHEHLYAWTVSAAYQTGAVPVALQLTALVLFLTWFALQMYALRSGVAGQASAPTADIAAVPTIAVEADTLRSWLVLTVYAAVNTLLVVTVNTAFVYVTLRASSSAVSVAQLALALFKICWNDVSSSGRFVRFLAAKLDPSYVPGPRGYHPESTNFVMLAVALFNTLAIPCMAVLVISPDCFYNVFVGAPAVESQYIMMQCSNSDGVTCVDYTPFPQSSSYSPPFAYSYQCSSSFVTYYAPAFVYMCLMTGVGTPLQQLACLHLRERLKNTSLFKFADALVPRILFPVPPGSHEPAKDQAQSNPLSPSTANEVSNGAAAPPRSTTYFNARSHVQSLLVYLGVLLTFGLVFPPLAACVAVTVGMMYVYMRLCVGRFVRAAQLQGQLHCLVGIEEACAAVGGNRFLFLAAWALITVSCWFYTLFLFDTLGDAVGFQGAYWVLIVVPCVPVVVWGLQRSLLQVLSANSFVCSVALKELCIQAVACVPQAGHCTQGESCSVTRTPTTRAAQELVRWRRSDGISHQPASQWPGQRFGDDSCMTVVPCVGGMWYCACSTLANCWVGNEAVSSYHYDLAWTESHDQAMEILDISVACP